MKSLPNWLKATWDSVRTGLWLVPAFMFVLGIALAAVMVEVDEGVGIEDSFRRWWLTSGSGEDAASLLGTLLTAIITMASMAFSVTVVALSLAASAYGPRLIRIFRADIRTQAVLGFFVLTIVYLLIVLRSVRREMDMTDVPHLSVTLGALLALACVVALLAFIQRVARSIVADEVVKRVSNELHAAIASLPEESSAASPRADLPPAFDEEATRLRLPRDGYVQSVDYGEIVEWARARDALVRLDFRPGDFVVGGDCKVLVHPAPPDPETAQHEIDRFIVSGQERTPTQDLEYSVRHLVEIAVRALSPGVNDPFTALAVIDRLRSALVRLAHRQLPLPALHDARGSLRVVRRVSDFAGVADAAFDQIRQAAAGVPSVRIHMLETISEIAPRLVTDGQRHDLARHVHLISSDPEDAKLHESDQSDIRRVAEQALKALSCSRVPPPGK